MEDNASPEKWYILTRLRRAAHCWRHNLTTSEEFLPTPKMLDEAADEIEQLYNQSISPKIEHLPGTSALKIAINQIEEELPGMLALQMAIERGEWPHTMDAQVWTQKWMETIQEHPEIPNDEGAMIGWFANAIMAGYDLAMANQQETSLSPL